MPACVISTWNMPALGGRLAGEELLVAFDRARPVRIMILPAWFDEANKLRRFTIEVMRRLDKAGIDVFLPDLPGCNESLAPLVDQTLTGWRTAASAAASSLNATHILTIRAGALIAQSHMPGWHYAPQSGARLLRGMIRARTIAAREMGIAETTEALMALGRSERLMLGGWPLGAAMIGALETAEPALAASQSAIAQTALGGPGLWLRAEPGEDAAQADALAAIIAGSLA